MTAVVQAFLTDETSKAYRELNKSGMFYGQALAGTNMPFVTIILPRLIQTEIEIRINLL